MSATPSPSELDRLRLLYDLGCAFAAHTDIDELIPFVIRQCRDVLGAAATQRESRPAVAVVVNDAAVALEANLETIRT